MKTLLYSSAPKLSAVFAALLVAIALTSCAYAAGASGSTTNQPGEILIPLRSGQSAVISYGLFYAATRLQDGTSSRRGSDLVLLLRNVGAKSINMDDVSANDFDLRDANGKIIKFYLWSKPRTMGYGDATIIHLMVDHPKDAPQPWTLRFTSKPQAHVPFDILITGITTDT